MNPVTVEIQQTNITIDLIKENNQLIEIGFTGPQGPKGNKGDRGYSAYEVAVNNGFTGTEAQWLDSLGISVQRYPSIANFPNLGNPATVYLVDDESACYKWDADLLRYICVGRDWKDIEVIDGGHA